MTDWQAWHEHYDDPASSLARRLKVVQARLDEVLNGSDRVHRMLGLCAGDGRDVIPVVARLRPERRPEVVLVELDPVLATAARDRAAAAGLDVTVLVGDAGATATWSSALPVDLLMLCGIFGNVSDDDIRTCIAAVPSMVSDGGAVIWTRGAFSDRDIRPLVRRWFSDAGFDEIAFDSEPAGYGVGVNRTTSRPDVGTLPPRLFTFTR